MSDPDCVEKVFNFKFPTCTTGQEYDLSVPVKIPYSGSVKELTHRIISAFKLPCYVEDDLLESLEIAVKKWTLEFHDERADLLVKAAQKGDTDVEEVIKSWEKLYKSQTAAYAEPIGTTDEELFAAAYHRLVHSPSLETILQAEHEFGRAVTDVVQQRDKEFEKLTEKYVKFFKRRMNAPNTFWKSMRSFSCIYEIPKTNSALEKDPHDDCKVSPIRLLGLI